MLVRFLSVLLVVAATAFPAASHEYTLGDLRIVHPWARASAGEAKNGALYLEIVNTGDTPDRLVGASTPAADMAELHMHMSENGIMKMRPVEAVDLAPGEHVVLKPGGLHVMLMGLKGTLVEGVMMPITLVFEKAGSIEVEAEVASVATMHGEHGGGAGTQ
jgi:hypothetical protein